MKSRITLSIPHRAATFAGLLALGSLALPSAGYAQAIEAERALLNKTDAPFGVSEWTATPVIDGARALLGRPGVSAPQVFTDAPIGVSEWTATPVIDGARALLGRPGVRAPQVFQPAGSSRPTFEDAYRIDGERALLGRSFGSKATHANSAPRN